jgi:hypothetical protein
VVAILLFLLSRSGFDRKQWKSVELEEAVAACSAVVVGVCVVEVWYGSYTGSTSFMVFGGGVKDLWVICNIVFM